MSEPANIPKTSTSTSSEEPDDEVLLPPLEERRFVLEQLAGLVRARGYEHLILAPLLRPDERYFPDPWAGGEASVRRVTRRLLVYADLPDFDVEVKLYDDAEVGGPVTRAGAGAPAWFFRLQNGTLAVAARVSALRDPLVLVPALARAVAEGWRVHHGLTVKDTVTEQRLVDLTTIFLGFGVLTTDATVRHSAQRTGGFRLSRSKSILGVLPPQSMAFALAVQAVARQMDTRDVKALRRELQPNQAGFFTAALEVLRVREPSVSEVLALPPKDSWAQAPALESLTAPFEDDELEAPESRRDEDRGVVGMNEGRPVFRVERSKATRLAKIFGLPVAMLGMLAGRMQMGVELPMWQVGIAAASLAILGLVVGRFLPDRRCSEPKCGQALGPSDEACPRCHGKIVGSIGHPKERLAAEEAWRRDHADEAAAEAS